MRTSSPDQRPPVEAITKPTETPEEALERRIAEGEIETAIFKFAQKFNEGNNGVILRVNLLEIPELAGLKKYLERKGEKIEGGQAIKILKIYAPGAGRREFEMQRRAFEILAQNPQTGLAKIPRPLAMFDIHIQEETRVKLHFEGANGVNDRAEIIVMDYIPGSDLATVLYREAIKRDERFVHLRKDLEEMPFEQLQQEVSDVLFYKARSKARDSAQRSLDEERVMDENAKILYDLLEKRGLVLHPAILDQIEKTMHLFHAHGLCFRDGHHRNFLVVGVHEATAEETPQVFVIDFGSATSFEGEFSEALYQEGTRRFYDDLAVVRELRPLTTSREEKRGKETETLLLITRKNRDRLLKHPEWIAFWKEKILPQTKQGINLTETFKTTWFATRLPLKAEEFVEATLLEMIEQGLVDRNQVIKYVEELLIANPKLKKPVLPIATQNSLRNFLRIL